MRKTILLVFVLVLALASICLAAEDTWTQKADMPTARSCLATSVVNGKIYAIGGIKNASSAPLSTVEEYNPEKDTWTTKSNMPTARISLFTSVVNGKIYAIGGGRSVYGSGLSTVEEYDPVSDTWTTKSNMPTARFVLSSNVVNGKIYAIGGKPAHGVSPLKTVEEYDPVTDTWTTKTNMRTARYGLCTCVVNDRIYAIGGDPGTYVGLRTVEEYDPTTDTWTRKADMLTPRAFLSVSVLGGRIYAIGGESTLNGAGLSIVDEYDPATDTWTRKSDMPTPRLLLSSSAVNSRIYVMGGAVKPLPTWQACSTVEEYDPFSLVVDFNGDGIVDSADMCMMVDHWHTDNALYDISPAPFGDGIVDIQDLVVLSEHLFTYPGAVAYWKLDETEGIIAHDSVGDNDAFLMGDPAWQPDGGIVDGTLQLDGIDDYVSTPFVLNPEKGSFSAFAWIKGGAPGQVIISQTGGFGGTWLGTNSSEGKLMTGLSDFFGALESESVITDGQWHHVGLLYDLASHRHLYVDGVEVNVDSDYVAGLRSNGGLQIGAGKNLDPRSFFSGLIDDVRIYNRAVTP